MHIAKLGVLQNTYRFLENDVRRKRAAFYNKTDKFRSSAISLDVL